MPDKKRSVEIIFAYRKGDYSIYDFLYVLHIESLKKS